MRGPNTGPLGLHALWGLRAAGVVGGRPLGGRPATVVRGVWCQALPLPRLPALWAGCQCPLPTCCGRGACLRAWGPCTGPVARVPCGGLRATGVAGGVRVQAPPLPCCPPSGQAARARWPRAVGANVDVCGVCGACAMRAVVLGVALRLSLWCPPPWCFNAVLCSPCACRAPFPARVPCSSAGYLPFLSWLRGCLPFPLPSVGSPSSLVCTFSLLPPWCVSRSFPLPASLAPVLGPSSSSPVGSCETEGGLGRVGLLGN